MSSLGLCLFVRLVDHATAMTISYFDVLENAVQYVADCLECDATDIVFEFATRTGDARSREEQGQPHFDVMFAPKHPNLTLRRSIDQTKKLKTRIGSDKKAVLTLYKGSKIPTVDHLFVKLKKEVGEAKTACFYARSNGCVTLDDVRVVFRHASSKAAFEEVVQSLRRRVEAESDHFDEDAFSDKEEEAEEVERGMLPLALFRPRTRRENLIAKEVELEAEYESIANGHEKAAAELVEAQAHCDAKAAEEATGRIAEAAAGLVSARSERLQNSRRLAAFSVAISDGDPPDDGEADEDYAGKRDRKELRTYGKCYEIQLKRQKAAKRKRKLEYNKARMYGPGGSAAKSGKGAGSFKNDVDVGDAQRDSVDFARRLELSKVSLLAEQDAYREAGVYDGVLVFIEVLEKRFGNEFSFNKGDKVDDVLRQKEHIKSVCFLVITKLQFYVAHGLHQILHLHVTTAEARGLEEKCRQLGISRYWLEGDRDLQVGCVAVWNAATPGGRFQEFFGDLRFDPVGVGRFVLAEQAEKAARLEAKHFKVGDGKRGVACRNFGVTTQHYQTETETETAICKPSCFDIDGVPEPILQQFGVLGTKMWEALAEAEGKNLLAPDDIRANEFVDPIRGRLFLGEKVRLEAFSYVMSTSERPVKMHVDKDNDRTEGYTAVPVFSFVYTHEHQDGRKELYRGCYVGYFKAPAAAFMAKKYAFADDLMSRFRVYMDGHAESCRSKGLDHEYSELCLSSWMFNERFECGNGAVSFRYVAVVAYPDRYGFFSAPAYLLRLFRVQKMLTVRQLIEVILFFLCCNSPVKFWAVCQYFLLKEPAPVSTTDGEVLLRLFDLCVELFGEEEESAALVNDEEDENLECAMEGPESFQDLLKRHPQKHTGGRYCRFAPSSAPVVMKIVVNAKEKSDRTEIASRLDAFEKIFEDADSVRHCDFNSRWMHTRQLCLRLKEVEGIGDVLCQLVFPVAVFSGIVRTEYHAAYAYVSTKNAGVKALYEAAGKWDDVLAAKRKLQRTMGLSEGGVESGICESYRPNMRHDVFFEGQWIARLHGSDKDGWVAQMREPDSRVWKKLQTIDEVVVGQLRVS